MQQEKEAKGITPTHILFSELMNASDSKDTIRQELNALFAAGKIKVVRTLNQTAVCKT